MISFCQIIISCSNLCLESPLKLLDCDASQLLSLASFFCFASLNVCTHTFLLLVLQFSVSIVFYTQEELLPGGHGLMVRGYLPVINTLAKGLDIRLSHR